MNEPNESEVDAMMESTTRWKSFRAHCYSVHEDGSGAYVGEWRSSPDQAQVDCEAHDKEKHGGASHAKIDFK
jgi:hypothetical protein